MLTIWCISHKVNLAWKSICKEINAVVVTKVINRANAVSKYFRGAGNRSQKLKNISNNRALSIKNVHYPPYFKVR